MDISITGNKTKIDQNILVIAQVLKKLEENNYFDLN